MWLKLCLLLIYVTFLFIIARLIEAVTWYETGYLSRRLIDPMTLSVMKLKALLHQRGVTFDGVVEKTDLTQLVETTGPAIDDEVDMALAEEDSSDETVFQSGAHFYEQVEDAKDSIWMISVIMGESMSQHFISETTWKSIKKRVFRFGIRVGLMDCSHYPNYCYNKGINSPQLLLALPQDFTTKATIKMYSYRQSPRESNINKWIHEKLDQKINTVKNFKEFKRNWLQYKHNFLDPEIRTILFSTSKVIPLFYSALSLKYPGRVKFGKVDMLSYSRNEFLSYFQNDLRVNGSLPHYLIITPEETLIYGINDGEYLTYEALEIYFKCLYPSLNDLFILSFGIVNIMSWFEFFEVQGTLLKRLRKFLWCAMKYNVLLIMTWLPLVGIFSLPNVDKVTMLGLKIVRLISTSSIAVLIRKDISYFTNHVRCLGLSFILYSVFVGFIQYMKQDNNAPENSVDEEDLWNFNQMRTLQHLFRPPDSIGQLESGLRAFGVSSPTLWLRPSGSLEYIPLLPTWEFYSEKDQQVSPSSVKDITDKANEAVEEIHQACETSDSVPSVGEIQKNSTFPAGYLVNYQCVICLDDYSNGTMLCGLPCGHSFHEKCILSWLNRDNHYCPVCRWPADQPKNITLHLHCE